MGTSNIQSRRQLLAIKIVWAILFILIGIGIVFYCRYHGLFLPNWVIWEMNQSDLGNNKRIQLANKKLSYYQDDTLLWESEKDWKISKYLITDIDEDDQDEVIMLLWNRGDYGDYHPIWEKPDKINYYEHLYVFNLEDNRLERQWMSSRLLPLIKELEIGKENTLVAKDPEGVPTTWKWITWGFTAINP
ncbi:MAG: hypothetical protein IKE51_05025 [Solobacterium sp.]|nr:hypothetical protein [Solobacterium sp.]